MLADPKANDKKYFRSTRVTFLPNSNTLCRMEPMYECFLKSGELFDSSICI